MIEALFAQIRGLAKNWEGEAFDRRRITTVDPVADTIAYQASELTALVNRLERDTELLSPAQYARIHRKTPQTVTAWCRDGKLDGAVRSGRSYLIPRTAVPPAQRRARRTAAR